MSGVKNPFNKLTHPFVYKGYQYAIDIVNGEIKSSIYIYQTCKRSLNEWIDQKHPNYYFDKDKAEKYLRLTQKFEHPVGEWVSKNITYEPWQCWVWGNIMGFYSRKTKYRRFRHAYVEIARGNSKSTMSSMCALYLMSLEGGKGNQISAVATKKEQARIVFDACQDMARNSKTFIQKTGVLVRAHDIVHKKSNSKIRPLASDANSLDGLMDVLAILDELHRMRKDTYDVIVSGMKKRKDSLVLCITTAGNEAAGVGFEQSSWAKQVALGNIPDETSFCAVYCVEPTENMFDESIWIKANPNLGVSVDLDGLRSAAEKAKAVPSEMANFKIKHLNVWISEAEAFFDLNKYDQCPVADFKSDKFKRMQARMAIDLASHIDVTSIALVFRDKEGKFYATTRNYIPEATVKEHEAMGNVSYTKAADQGELIITPGEAINYEFIQKEAEKLALEYNIIECLYDGWQANETAQRLSGRIEMVKLPLNTGNMSAATKKLDVVMREKRFEHDGSKFFRWCLGNIVAKEDHNGNVYPRKNEVRLKIDPPFAVIMAIAGWINEEINESVYETRSIRVI